MLRAGRSSGLRDCCAAPPRQCWLTRRAAARRHVGSGRLRHLVLNDVDCPSTRTCHIIGNDVSDPNHTRAFAEAGNGASWVSTQAHEPAHREQQLPRGVSCPSVGRVSPSDPSMNYRCASDPSASHRGRRAGLDSRHCLHGRHAVVVGPLRPAGGFHDVRSVQTNPPIRSRTPPNAGGMADERCETAHVRHTKRPGAALRCAT